MKSADQFKREQRLVHDALTRGISLREIGVTQKYIYYILRDLDDKFTLEAEKQAVKRQIAKERDVNAAELVLSAHHGEGLVYHLAVDPSTGRGLIFLTSPSLRSEFRRQVDHSLERNKWREKELKKFARRLGVEKLEILEPLRLFDNELRTLLSV